MRRKNYKLRWALRRRSRLLGIWSFFCVLAFIYWLRESLKITTINEFEDVAAVVIARIIQISFLFFVGLVIYIFFKRKENKSSEFITPTFKDQPWMFDKEFVYLIAKVEKVLANKAEYDFKKQITNIWRTIIKDNNPAGRYIHQRFLISSPLLKEDENVLIINNIKSNSITVKDGQWIEIQGEYIHSLSRKRTAYGSELTFYGKIHYTHPPLGFVRILETKPDLSSASVKIIENVKKEHLRNLRKGGAV